MNSEIDPNVQFGAFEKCQCDPFIYWVKLSDGSTYEFEGGKLSEDGKWIHISGVTTDQYIANQTIAYTFERGIDILVSSIIAMADAPYGS